MKILIVGLGSIGRRHLNNLRQLMPDARIAIWHLHTSASEPSAADALADHCFYSRDDALAFGPEATLVTGPASCHIPIALDLARNNSHLFIEKPLAHSLAGVDELLAVCRARERVLLVGYVFHFYPPFHILRQAIQTKQIGSIYAARAEAGQYLPDWRPGTDYRLGVTAQAQLGGGAILELSHELDYLRWMLGEASAVSAQARRVSDLALDVEDIAEIIIDFIDGAIGNVHLDLLQRAPTRTLKVIGANGTLTWDGMTHQVGWFDATTQTWSDLFPAQTLDRNQMYLDELKHFLACVRGEATPIVSGEDGKRALQIALAAKQSAHEGRRIML